MICLRCSTEIPAHTLRLRQQRHWLSEAMALCSACYHASVKMRRDAANTLAVYRRGREALAALAESATPAREGQHVATSKRV